MHQDKILVRSEKVLGTVAHFRAIMEKLARLYLGEWTSSSGETLRFEEWRFESTLSTTSTWYVWIPIPWADVPQDEKDLGLYEIEQTHRGDACIAAYEHARGYTEVYFWDRYSLSTLETKRVGEPFEEFCKLVIEALQGQDESGRGTEGRTTIPEKPTEPKQSAPLEHWFHWRLECQEVGYKVTLRDIANMAGYSRSYVKKQHVLYKAEHEA